MSTSSPQRGSRPGFEARNSRDGLPTSAGLHKPVRLVVCGQGCAIQAYFWAFFLAVKKNLHSCRPHLRHRTAGQSWSRVIAGAACPHQLLCMVKPDLPCVCAGILTLRVFLRSFLAGPQIICIDWHDTV